MSGVYGVWNWGLKNLNETVAPPKTIWRWVGGSPQENPQVSLQETQSECTKLNSLKRKTSLLINVLSYSHSCYICPTVDIEGKAAQPQHFCPQNNNLNLIYRIMWVFVTESRTHWPPGRNVIQYINLIHSIQKTQGAKTKCSGARSTARTA